MNQVTRLPSGATVEISVFGITVIAKDGERVRFDSNGKQIVEAETLLEAGKRKPRWFKHFDIMGAKQCKQAEDWLAKEKEEIDLTELSPKGKFLTSVERAVKFVDYNYRVANLEPSCDENGKLYYKEGEVVCKDLSCEEWRRKAYEFAPEYGSRIANMYEYVLWIAWRAAMGYWDLEFVCEDSSGAGNHSDSNECSGHVDVSGAKIVGGAKDGVGNTRKIVACNDGYVFYGTDWEHSGKQYPVAHFAYKPHPVGVVENACAVVVMKG